MVKKKPEKDFEKELIILKKKIDELGAEIKGLVQKAELDELKKELKKLEKHENLLSENAKFMNELVNELSKVKESHRLTRKHVLAKENVSKQECEERFGAVKDALKDLEQIRSTHKKKAEHDDLVLLRKELNNRLSQIEYQHKLLMYYLKKVDEILQQKS